MDEIKELIKRIEVLERRCQFFEKYFYLSPHVMQQGQAEWNEIKKQEGENGNQDNVQSQ